MAGAAAAASQTVLPQALTVMYDVLPAQPLVDWLIVIR